MDKLAAWTTAMFCTLGNRFRGEAGQGSVEYVGIIIVVVAIIVAVVAQASGVGDAIATQLTNAVEKIGEVGGTN
ncbi:hypothetical protein [Sanguibacter antarcticus]|uniref:Pilus assembly protein Flp/PilA n=1 Tax=Sanguibacter antarcticus TaxID=372484 RepID=A0A2A9E759_9MICO|nr:hypothetical protein [Sanguibacter antarcticus]PFG34683.1 hypothetical protein ATL42_2603 [Sanguibacter antarcticus]